MGITSRSAAGLLRDARRASGLSQAALAQRAGVTQSVISAYESGARQPSLVRLASLVEATGSHLRIDICQPETDSKELAGHLGSRVRQHREELRSVAARHGVSQLRVFGSVARGDDEADSDVDLLVDLPPGTGLLGLARLQRDLEQILGVSVDVVPADDLKPDVRPNVDTEAVLL